MSIPSFLIYSTMSCISHVITCLLHVCYIARGFFDTAVRLNLVLDVIFFFNILPLGDLISHIWRGDRRWWRVKTDLLRFHLPLGEILQSDYLRYFWLHL